MKKAILFVFAIIVMTVIGIGIFRHDSYKSPQQHVVDVTVQEALRDKSVSEHVFGATVKSVQEAVVGARVSGTLTHMNLKEGDHVKKGQVLAVIDAGEYAAQYAQSSSALNMAIEEEKYARRKWDDLKPEQREQYKLETERLRAVVRESGAYVEKTRIVAPFDGVISQKFVSDGTTVMSGESVVRVVGDLMKKEIVFDMPAEWGKWLDVDHIIQVRHKNVSEDAKIIAIDPVADEQTRKITIHASLSALSVMHVGDFVDVVVLLSPEEDAVNSVAVPVASVVRMYDDHFIFVVVDDHVVMRRVKILSVHDDHSIVKGVDTDVNVNDRIVVSGAQNLSDGDRVHIISF